MTGPTESARHGRCGGAAGVVGGVLAVARPRGHRRDDDHGRPPATPRQRRPPAARRSTPPSTRRSTTTPRSSRRSRRTRVDIAELLPQIIADPDGAGEKYGHRAGVSSPYAYPVTGDGVAGKVDGTLLPVTIDGLPDGVAGDAPDRPGDQRHRAAGRRPGLVDFNDFLNQIEYANAATELNNQVKSDVLADFDARAPRARRSRFIGAFAYGSNTAVHPGHPGRARGGPVTAPPPRRTPSAPAGVVMRARDDHQGLRRHARAARGRLRRPRGRGDRAVRRERRRQVDADEDPRGRRAADHRRARARRRGGRPSPRPTDAVARGVAIIHQELNLCPNLSVTDNLFMGRELVRGLLRRRRRAERRDGAGGARPARGAASTRRRRVGDLRLGQQQVVEIARAISLRRPRPDHGRADLGAVGAEVEVLFRVIRELTARGVSIVYISHHLEEALEIADDVVVLRDGALVADARWRPTSTSAGSSRRWSGATPTTSTPDRTTHRARRCWRCATSTSPTPTTPAGWPSRSSTSTVHAGEIVGLYGLMGAGRTELLETLAGRLPAPTAPSLVDGVDLTDGDGRRPHRRGPRARARGPPARRPRPDDVGRRQHVRWPSIRSFLRGLVPRRPARRRTPCDGRSKDVTVKTAGPDAAIGSLSGGNQQKVVIGKVLLTAPARARCSTSRPAASTSAPRPTSSRSWPTRPAPASAVLFATSEVGEALHACRPGARHAPRPRRAPSSTPAPPTEEDLMAASERRARRRAGHDRPQPDSPPTQQPRRSRDHEPPPHGRRDRPAWMLRAGDVLLEQRAFIALIVIVIIFSRAVGHVPDRLEPHHDDPARRHQRDPRAGHAAGHHHRRHRPVGRLDRRACPGSSPACCCRAGSSRRST